MLFPFGITFVKVAQQFGPAYVQVLVLHGVEAKDVTLVVACRVLRCSCCEYLDGIIYDTFLIVES